jgi:hypothetical protein
VDGGQPFGALWCVADRLFNSDILLLTPKQTADGFWFEQAVKFAS